MMKIGLAAIAGGTSGWLGPARYPAIAEGQPQPKQHKINRRMRATMIAPKDRVTLPATPANFH